MSTAADKFVRHTLALSGGKLYHKLSDSDKMDAFVFHAQIFPYFIVEMTVRERRCL